MTRSAARTTGAPSNPEYAGGRRGRHPGVSPDAAHHQLGDLLARMAREADARIPDGRRARRTLQEMMPGYQRQPVLTFHRPVMADDACPLCLRWSCDGTDCPPSATVPAATPTAAPAVASGDGQCSVCSGRFPGWPGGVCDACRALGN
ncbi:hypothetical protein ACIQ9J_35190 [Streptomyces sp. NPDC094153]|uniref:hypothetical protein n=1 Tax=Streptomyces sp. NPDC094153 TaxID=3366058 RepID=UPI0038038D8D